MLNTVCLCPIQFVPQFIFTCLDHNNNQKCDLVFPVSSTWSQPETQGRHLSARHGHIIIAVGSKIYIHGGMAGDKFHNDMYTLDTSKPELSYVIIKGSKYISFPAVFHLSKMIIADGNVVEVCFVFKYNHVSTF